jgi:outer membrane protein OmpA-like peptidoglycan-associated protein
MTAPIIRAVGRLVAPLLAFVLLLGVAACSSPAPAPELSSAISEDCEKLFALPPGDGARVVVAADWTASSGGFAGGDRLDEIISEAALDTGTVSVLAIQGPEEPGWLRIDAALNEADLDSGTSRFGSIAELAPTCVEQLASTARPVHDGSDVLGALHAGAAQLRHDGTLYVETDGASNAGMLDFARQEFGADPARVVSALASVGQIPDLTGVTLVMAGIGASAQGLHDPAVIDWMVAVYGEICLAGGAVDCEILRGTATMPRALDASLPEDVGLPFPELEAPRVEGEACVFPLAGDVLFGGFSSTLTAGAGLLFDDLAARIGDQQVDILVVGHTTTFGDPQVNETLSLDRARAAADALVARGLDASRIEVEGRGGTEPVAVPDHDASGVIDANARQNRRVEVVVTGLGVCG